jgi:hypothetical protein
MHRPSSSTYAGVHETGERRIAHEPAISRPGHALVQGSRAKAPRHGLASTPRCTRSPMARLCTQQRHFIEKANRQAGLVYHHNILTSCHAVVHSSKLPASQGRNAFTQSGPLRRGPGPAFSAQVDAAPAESRRHKTVSPNQASMQGAPESSHMCRGRHAVDVLSK